MGYGPPSSGGSGGITNTAPEGFGTRADADGNIVAWFERYAGRFTSATDPEIAVEVLLDLPIPIVWEREDVGVYQGVSAGAFDNMPTQKGVIVNASTAAFGQWMVEAVDEDTIQLTIRNSAGLPVDRGITDYYISFDVFLAGS